MNRSKSHRLVPSKPEPETDFGWQSDSVAEPDLSRHQRSGKQAGVGFSEAPSRPSFRGLTQDVAQPPSKGVMVQPKLMIGAPNDRYEQEADRVAAQVVRRMQAPPVAAPEAMAEEPTVQRQPVVQAAGGITGGVEASPEVTAGINAARGSGQPLNGQVRVSMEQAFGADFSGVRVHTDSRADGLNTALGAKAFTNRQDLFFKWGEYQPRNRDGQGLIAHELAHVVQQGTSLNKTQLQRRIDEDLSTGEVKVVLAGERHHEIPQDEEIETWEKRNIDIYYEDGEIVSKEGQTITVEDTLLRLTSCVAVLTAEHLSLHPNPDERTFDFIEALKLDLELHRRHPYQKNDLENINLAEITRLFDTLLAQKKELMEQGNWGDLKKREESQYEFLKISKIQKYLENEYEQREEKFDAGMLYRPSEFLPLAKRRSTKMFENAKKIARTEESLIIKVGQQHIEDIEADTKDYKSEVGSKRLKIINRSEYLKDYEAIKESDRLNSRRNLKKSLFRFLKRLIPEFLSS